MSEDLGGIYIEIELETRRLLDGIRQSQQGLDRISGGMGRVESSTRDAESAMFSFSKAAQLVAGSLTAGAIIKAVDDWGQMAARIKMALNSVEGDISRYAEIQERFLEVSNRNGKAIETTQALYAGSATSMKELGYNTAQTVDYIESLSSTFTANATSAQQTESAMTALNRAMVTGKLRGNDWDSVLSGIPSTVGDVARELSRLRGGIQVTEREVKQMAANGGIDMKLFADAVINAKDANNALADSMDNTIADGFTKLANSAKAYYGELNQTYGVTRSASAGFAVLSDNFDKVADAANIAALVIGARMAGAMATAGKEKLKYISDSVKLSKAEAVAAREVQYAASAVTRKAAADKSAAASAVALAQAEYNVARGSAAEMTALEALNAAKSRAIATSLALVQAKRAEAAATAAAGAAARAASVSFRLMNGALALVGGPVGVAVIAAAALYSWYEGAKRAKEEAISFADSLDGVIEKLAEMTAVQLDAMLAKTEGSIIAQEEKIRDLRKEIDDAKNSYKEILPEVSAYAEFMGHGIDILRKNGEANRDVREKTGELEAAVKSLKETQEKQKIIQEQLNAKVRDADTAFNELAKNLKDRFPKAGAAAIEILTSTMQVIDSLKRKASEPIVVGETRSADGDKLLAELKERNDLLSITDKRQRAVEAERLRAQKAGVAASSEQMSQIEAEAAKQFDLQEAEAASRESKKKTAKETDAVAESLARQQEQLDRLNTGYAEGSLELATYDAVQALGANASTKAIAQSNAQTEAIWRQQQAVKGLAAAENLLPEKQENTRYQQQAADLKNALESERITQAEYNAAAEKAAQDHQNNLSKIRSEAVVNPVAQSRGQIDPIQQLANENAKKLQLMRDYQAQEQAILLQGYQSGQMTHDQFTSAKSATDAQYLALRTAQEKQFQEQQTAAQWQLLSQQGLGYDILTSSIDAFSGNASNALTGLMTGSMSASDAMRSLGNTILNSAVNSVVQLGVEMLKNFILSETLGKAGMVANTAAAMAGGAAALAAWTPAAIAASIATAGAASGTGLTAYTAAQASGKALTILGGRKNGGPVSAGGIYPVGEGNLPEFLQTRRGLFMIPGDDGQVFSNKDSTGSPTIPKASTGMERLHQSNSNSNSNSSAPSGGLNVVINVTNNTSAQTQFTPSYDEQSNTLTIQGFIADMQEKGPMHRSITQNTSATTRL